ncbi:Z-ring formation inhibitor MciZ [Paenibacillus tyrfis]|uniref:Z-ring formation inhibitor MciZ n=1 Tax=Paenibacillus tyrfis TaxID=1501230 RepID=UPI00209CEAA9|nr:Z-ring formation inhibitor MciZ [Paenibacillus tyrfis]MCP1307196.1 Z-ring formation inhibitor MciZ [Paenibacillus tyrfis]
MKTYVNARQLRLVGKGWEIRNYLKMALDRVSPDVPLSAFLDGTRSSSAATAAPRSEGAGTPPLPPYKWPQKTPDRPARLAPW